jgi:hypothetical protein
MLQKKEEELEVLQNELQQKIKQNGTRCSALQLNDILSASLHDKIFEVKKEHEQALEVLQQKITALKTSLQQSQEELDIKQKQYTADKERMEINARELNEHLNAVRTELTK